MLPAPRNSLLTVRVPFYPDETVRSVWPPSRHRFGEVPGRNVLATDSVAFRSSTGLADMGLVGGL